MPQCLHIQKLDVEQMTGRHRDRLGVEVSQGFGAPSFAVLGPRGVVVLVAAEPCRSHGLGGAGRPVERLAQIGACFSGRGEEPKSLSKASLVLNQGDEIKIFLIKLLLLLNVWL